MKLDKFETQRLNIEKLQIADFTFIKELVNTEGWIKFIGDRNVRSDDDAKDYISKILENSNIHYWVARLKFELLPIGIVTFIKKDYLPYWDIGFAFLSSYMGKGLAFEVVSAALKKILVEYNKEPILATTNKHNSSSIRLLKKLGFTYERELKNDGKILQVYKISASELSNNNI